MGRAASRVAAGDFSYKIRAQHDLRAHSLSGLLEAGLPIPQVALISGHRNWKVLAKHYARLDAASVHDAVKRLS